MKASFWKSFPLAPLSPPETSGRAFRIFPPLPRDQIVLPPSYFLTFLFLRRLTDLRPSLLTADCEIFCPILFHPSCFFAAGHPLKNPFNPLFSSSSFCSSRHGTSPLNRPLPWSCDLFFFMDPPRSTFIPYFFKSSSFRHALRCRTPAECLLALFFKVYFFSPFPNLKP